MALFTSFDINATGMTAERFRMDTISQNVANANTTRTEDGTPYRRKIVVFKEKNSPTHFHQILMKEHERFAGNGVKVTGVYEDTKTEGNMVYDPSHPDADENGYVMYPNVNIITEFTNLIDASRAYQANGTAFSASKNMATMGLNILNG